MNVVGKLIRSTKQGVMQWDYRDESDPYFMDNKEEYTFSYKITDNKTVDGVITKLSLTNNYNYFLRTFFNIKEPKINRQINEVYYSNNKRVFILFLYAKYYSYIGKQLGVNNYVKEVARNLHHFHWVPSNEGVVRLYKARLDTEPGRKGYAKLVIRDTGWVNIYSPMNSIIIAMKPTVNINLYKEVSSFI